MTKENMRVFDWAAFDENGIMRGIFRYKEDAEQFGKAAKIEHKPVITFSDKEGTYPVKCFATLLAVPMGKQ